MKNAENEFSSLVDWPDKFLVDAIKNGQGKFPESSKA